MHSKILDLSYKVAELREKKEKIAEKYKGSAWSDMTRREQAVAIKNVDKANQYQKRIDSLHAQIVKLASKKPLPGSSLR